MTKRVNLKLVYELFNNLIILNSNNQLIFEGNALTKKFGEFGIDLHVLKNNIQTPETPVKILLESFEVVKTNQTPTTIILGESNEEFTVFPISTGNERQIAITKKENLSRISTIEHDLNERVKELRGLYNVSNELDSPGTIPEKIERCIPLIEAAFQYPDQTVVNIILGKKLYGKHVDPNSAKYSMLSSNIETSGSKIGEMTVYLSNNGDFLEEERKMLEETAGKFGRVVEESENTVNLEKQKKILLAKNEALMKLTEECNKQRQKLRTFFNAITATIIVIDRDYNIIMSNKDQIGDTGKCFNKLFGLNSQCEKCPAHYTFENLKNLTIEREFEDKFYQLRSYPIFDEEGKVERILEVCLDNTVQKKMEAQLLQSYKLASLGKLVAGVAHEINNPNTFILGNLKIVQEAFNDIFPILDNYREKNENLRIARLNYDVFKENISTLVSDMINGANRTKKIVTDLRNFAKKDDGLLTEDVDLNYLIKNNMTLTLKHVKKFAQLEINLCPDLPTFKGNMNKLEQVILNLVMNASEAVENPNGIISIKTTYDATAKEVLLIIKDNGCGMDETTMKNIFDPFFTTKRNKGGTGLGLSISYGIVKDHDGKIEVNSKPGLGTTFTVRFPIKNYKQNNDESTTN